MRVIKKYSNRRLYDMDTSAYITQSEVRDIIRSGVEFQIIDADSGEDLTRSVLIQIILEQEGGEKPMFTTRMLTRLIRFYDDTAQGSFGDFLDKNLDFFQQQMKNVMDKSLLPRVQDMASRNFAMWQDMQQKFFDMAITALQRAKKNEKDKKDV